MDPPPNPPLSGLPESHIDCGSQHAEAFLCGVELEPAFEHDDGASFAVIAGPTTEPGTDPGCIGQGPFWMRVLLAIGLALEPAAERFQQSLFFLVEGIAQRPQ